MKQPKLSVILIMLAGLVFPLAACTSASEGSDISIEDAWGRPSPMVASAGAFYMTIRNSGQQDDNLLAASSPACGTVELHEAYLTDEGAMGMRPVSGGQIPVPANQSVELKPGGLHVMCIDKQVEFEIGAILPLTLQFEGSGNLDIEIEIRQP